MDDTRGAAGALGLEDAILRDGDFESLIDNEDAFLNPLALHSRSRAGDLANLAGW
jgi:hypothetical protein